MSIGEKIKMYRKSKRLTQEQLGELSGLSKNAIYNYENNKRTPNIDIIKKIANALEVPISILTDEINVMNWVPSAGGLEDNSKVEKLRNKLNVTKLTSDNINSIRYNLEKDKIDLAITLLEDHGYKVTISENEIITINDYSDTLKPFNVDMDAFVDFSKNLRWAIDSFINKFIDENSTKNNIIGTLGNGRYILTSYTPNSLNNKSDNESIKLDDAEKSLIDKFGVGKGMHNRKKPDLKQADK